MPSSSDFKYVHYRLILLILTLQSQIYIIYRAFFTSTFQFCAFAKFQTLCFWNRSTTAFFFSSKELPQSSKRNFVMESLEWRFQTAASALEIPGAVVAASDATGRLPDPKPSMFGLVLITNAFQDPSIMPKPLEPALSKKARLPRLYNWITASGWLLARS